MVYSIYVIWVKQIGREQGQDGCWSRQLTRVEAQGDGNSHRDNLRKPCHRCIRGTATRATRQVDITRGARTSW